MIKKYAVALVWSLLAPGTTLACSNLLGTWQSSKALSMAHLNKQETIAPKTIAFHEQILGILTITYHANHVRLHPHPTITVTVEGDTFEWPFIEETFPYRLVSQTPKASDDCGAATIEMDYPEGYLVSTGSTTINFVDADTFWATSNAFPDSREYFVRLDPEPDS